MPDKTTDTYNPLDKHNLAKSVEDALLKTEPLSFPLEPFIGAGIYAIYYKGGFPLYRKIAKLNRKEFVQPIYVGKAIPAGARKGNFGLDAEPGQALYQRLCDHAKSIEEANNLSLSDFSCRFLSVDDIWIPLAESLLIKKFSPLWNQKMDGFGNHDPGKGRYNQQVSQWDTIHPGRTWAARLNPREEPEADLRKSIEQFIETHYNETAE